MVTILHKPAAGYTHAQPHQNQELTKSMINHNGKYRERTNLLWIVLLAFFLFGCGSTAEVKTVKPVSAEMIANGNVENGRKLFMGYAHFQNDGPPCMGCHSVGENGLLGGGVMGPNLTDVSNKLSQGEIISFLSNSGTKISPVMKPIFTEHPLTESEQADLIAFMQASVGQPESDREIIVFGISLAGLVGAIALLGFVYRGRLRSIRRALVNKAQKELL
jgi:mono/diheme cytochrome c family protein